MRLRRDRIGGTMQDQHRSLDVALAWRAAGVASTPCMETTAARRRRRARDRAHWRRRSSSRSPRAGWASPMPRRSASLVIVSKAADDAPPHLAGIRQSTAAGTPSGSRRPSARCLRRTCRRRRRHSLRSASIWPVSMFGFGDAAPIGRHQQNRPAPSRSRRRSARRDSSGRRPNNALRLRLFTTAPPHHRAGRRNAKSQPSSAPRISCA